ncbi:site-specific integrase [Gimesia fumaroli]|uniref:Site-specific tyrosine recombinase XerC n=1 Tax=Gimesia fumaroli TaxID=2527976 RepID=A0A518I5Q6_9PLAN|nr:tyrosine-type recombinase/integrase [Gimesia fumaroli]QDV48431.1 site-specific tyrosine recombinase XerC [Gimesia fumaroli]
MASLENRTGYFNVVFRFGGKKYTRSLHTDDESEANRLLANLEQTVRDVKSGRISLPPDADIPTFLLSDGKLTTPHVSDSDSISETRLSLHELFESFFVSLPDDSLEESTISLIKTHRNNLLRILGKDVFIEDIDLNALDLYSKKRRRENGRRKGKVSSYTIKKELVTLRRVLQWGKKRGKHESEIPAIRDVQLPKSTERPIFQTFDEITVQVEQGDLTEEQQSELWECLYLRTDEIDQLIQHVRKNALHTFLYPMVVAAAHTGARRSELMRSQLTDIRDDVLIIREKKRRRGQESTRRVPMSTLLNETLHEWKGEHPGGKYTFAVKEISNRKHAEIGRAISRDEAHSSFKRVLKDSKWSVIPGWHCLRHSFISNLASNSIDQRLIDEFVGHTTEEMRRRYRHLFPEVKQAAIRSVFH